MRCLVRRLNEYREMAFECWNCHELIWPSQTGVGKLSQIVWDPQSIDSRFQIFPVLKGQANRSNRSAAYQWVRIPLVPRRSQIALPARRICANEWTGRDALEDP
jgi:hypothetical protein